MQWKDFLYFNKRERKGFIILIICILLGMVLNFIYDSYKRKTSKLSFNEASSTEELYTPTKDSLWISPLKNTEESTKNTKVLNLNSATMEDLVEIGAPKHIAQNIINYREKAKRFRDISQLHQLYTMTDSIFEQISPRLYIKPVNKQNYKKPYASQAKEYTKKYSIPKFTKDTLININHCDTTILKQIPGIGSYTAAKIIRYGERLGGYHSIDQLYEIKIDSALVDKWFKIEANPTVKTLDINKTEFSELLRHPYLEYEEVKAIFNYKRKHGELKNIKELLMIEPFDSIKVKRISPYIRFS